MKFSHTEICSVCKAEKENLEHILTECKGVNDIWKWANAAIASLNGNTCQISKCEKITNYSRQAHQHQPIVDALIGITRYEIWKRRCTIKYDMKEVNIAATIASIKTNLQKHLYLIKNRLMNNKNICQEKWDKFMRHITRKTP